MLTVSITEDNLFTALGAFIVGAVGGAGVEVVRGQVNRVAMPGGEPIVMSPVLSVQLATPVSTFDGTNRNIQQSTQWNVQIDCYGAGGNDRARILSMLLRTEYGVSAITASGFDVVPLYAEESKQLPLTSGEQQYIERWSFDAVLQYNPRVSVPQDSAIVLTAGIVTVPRIYP
jgi:hypothetical protein